MRCRWSSNWLFALTWLLVALPQASPAALRVEGQALRAAEALRSRASYLEPGFLAGSRLNAARDAACALQARFRALPATVGTNPAANPRVRTCATFDLLSDEIWPELPSGLCDVVVQIDRLRAELALATGRPLLEDVELQLLVYDADGGHYARHVDDGIGTKGRPVRRSVSLLLYLTPDDWCSSHGGQLRLHAATEENVVLVHVAGGRGHTKTERLTSSALHDIEPAAGLLVLFDSGAVPHEVLATRRERAVLVGWLLEPRNPRPPADTKEATL